MMAFLGGFWGGTALALVWRLDQQARVLLTCAFLWSLIASAGDWNSIQWLRQIDPSLQNWATWLPLPILPAAIVFVTLIRTKRKLAWCEVGKAFGGFSLLFWTQGHSIWSNVLCLMAGPSAMLGAYIGNQIAIALAQLGRVHLRHFFLSAFAIPSG